jgi:hypothetical protein
MKCYTGIPIWTESLNLTRQRKMDVICETWNVRSLHGAGSLKTAASEVAKFNLHVMAVQ